MRNMFYLITRCTLKELNDEQDGLGYSLLMGLFVLGLIIDTLFLPASLVLSLLLRKQGGGQ